MKRYFLSGLIMISSSLFALNNDPPEDKITCVVSGDEINKSELSDHEFSSYREGKVYFCCGGCKMDFDKAPKKFSSKANFQLVSSGQYVQTACPVNSGKIHTERAKKNLKKVEISGMEVDLCCPGCLKKYNKSNDKFSLLFSDKGYEKGFEAATKKPEKTKK